MKCIIMRGVPGSGKSYAARQLVANSTASIVHSTDDFFYKDGVYRFDPNKLHYYHQKNLANAIISMEDGSPEFVVIDNTNITQKEFAPYVEAAVKCGYEVQYKEPDSPWWLSTRGALPIRHVALSITLGKTFASRTVHDVPAESIARMLRRWENIA